MLPQPRLSGILLQRRLLRIRIRHLIRLGLWIVYLERLDHIRDGFGRHVSRAAHDGRCELSLRRLSHTIPRLWVT